MPKKKKVKKLKSEKRPGVRAVTEWLFVIIYACRTACSTELLKGPL